MGRKCTHLYQQGVCKLYLFISTLKMCHNPRLICWYFVVFRHCLQSFSQGGWKLELPVAWCLIDAASLQLCDVFTDAVVMEWDTPAEADLVSSWPRVPFSHSGFAVVSHHIFPPHYDLRGLFRQLGFREMAGFTEPFSRLVFLMIDTPLEFSFFSET